MGERTKIIHFDFRSDRRSTHDLEKRQDKYIGITSLVCININRDLCNVKIT